MVYYLAENMQIQNLPESENSHSVASEQRASLLENVVNNAIGSTRSTQKEEGYPEIEAIGETSAENETPVTT